MVDDNGKVLPRMEAPTDPNRYADGIELIAYMLCKTTQRAGVELTGTGVGSKGPVDLMRGEFADVDFLPGGRGKSPMRNLAAIFNVRVALENDGDAAALAEARLGRGHD
jgi:glucokinase